MNIAGIYMIQSIKKPNRVYIGNSANIKRRWKEHKHDLIINSHHSKKLQNHYNKYEKNDLRYSILLECDPVRDDLISKEQFFIDSYNPFFNISPNAGSCLGVKISEEHRQRIIESNKTRIISDAHKENIRQANTGKKHSPEAKKKMSCSRRGIKFTEEHKMRISAAQKGRIFTKEHRERLAEARKKRITTDETKRRLSESHKGEKNYFFGKKHTKEARDKIRKAWEMKRQHKQVA